MVKDNASAPDFSPRAGQKDNATFEQEPNSPVRSKDEAVDLEAQKTNTATHDINNAAGIPQSPLVQPRENGPKKKHYGNTFSLLYFKFFDWWIRMPICLVIAFYIYMFCGNIATYRNNANPAFNPSNQDIALAGPLQHHQGLILPDYGYELVFLNNPRAHQYLASVPGISIGLMVIYAIFIKRNMILIAEAAAIETVMEACSGIAMAITTLPDPYGTAAVCNAPQYAHFGAWVFSRLNFTFCGNLIWSGHTYHTYLSLFIIYRGLTTTSSLFPNKCCSSLRVFQIVYWIAGSFWLLSLICMLIFTRFHYSVDVFIALLLTTFVVTNRNYVHFGVRFFYPPSLEQGWTNEELENLTDKAQYLSNVFHKDTWKLK